MSNYSKMGLKAIAGVAFFTVPMFASAQLNVNIYKTYTNSSTGGAPYADMSSTFSSPDIMFASNTGYNWHPDGLFGFGADITGCISLRFLGHYAFSLNSDDGSMFLIDNNLVINNGGAHGPNTVSNTVALTAGIHTIEVQFYEDFGGPSGVDLYLHGGVTYVSCVPEPSTVALMIGAGLSGASLLLRRRRKN